MRSRPWLAVAVGNRRRLYGHISAGSVSRFPRGVAGVFHRRSIKPIRRSRCLQSVIRCTAPSDGLWRRAAVVRVWTQQLREVKPDVGCQHDTNLPTTWRNNFPEKIPRSRSKSFRDVAKFCAIWAGLSCYTSLSSVTAGATVAIYNWSQNTRAMLSQGNRAMPHCVIPYGKRHLVVLRWVSIKDLTLL